MTPLIALALCFVFALGVLVLDRRRGESLRVATWIPLLWVLVLLSRPVSLWISPASIHADVPFDLTEGNWIDRTYFSALLVAGGAVLILRRVRWSAFMGGNLLIMAFIVYCAISISWSDYPYVAFKRWIKMIGDYVMLFLLLTEEDPDESIKGVIKTSALILLPLSIVFIKYFPVYGRMYHRWSGEAFYMGVTTHKNTLGLMCLLVGIFLFSYLCGVLRDREEIWKKLWAASIYVVLLALVVWLLLLARSSTSMLVFALGVGIYAFLGIPWVRRHPEFLSLYFISALVLAVIVMLLADVLPFMISLLGRDMTLTGRTQFWEDLLRMKNNPVIGTGFDSFWLGERAAWFWFEYYWRPNQAHNGFLEVYINLGLVGLMFLLAILVSFYRRSREELYVNYDRGRLRITLLVIVLLYNLTEASFKALSPLWFVLLLYNMEYMRPGSDSSPEEPVPSGAGESGAAEERARPSVVNSSRSKGRG